MYSNFIESLVNFSFNDPFETIQSKFYLEIGTRHCGTINLVAKHCDTAYGLDIEDFSEYVEHDNICIYNISSDKFINNILPELNIKFGVVFIDADHSENQSTKDFLGVFPYVVNNGLILLHDTYPPAKWYLQPTVCHTAYKTAEYIKKYMRDVCDIVTISSDYGLSIIRKANKQLLWSK